MEQRAVFEVQDNGEVYNLCSHCIAELENVVRCLNSLIRRVNDYEACRSCDYKLEKSREAFYRS